MVDAPVDGVPVAIAVTADFGADIDAVVDAASALAGTGAAVAGGRGCRCVGCGRGHGGRGCGGVNGGCGGGNGGSSGQFCQGEVGCQEGRSNYSRIELDHMLEISRKILPISGAEWDLVAACHATFHPDLGRTGDQLKKINKLTRTMILTWNSHIPPTILEVKEIRELIIEKNEGVMGSEEEPDDVALVDVPDDVEVEEDDANDAAVSHLYCLLYVFIVFSYS